MPEPPATSSTGRGVGRAARRTSRRPGRAPRPGRRPRGPSVRYGETSPSAHAAARSARSGRRRRGAAERVAALGAVAVLGGQPHVDVLPGQVPRPARHVEHEGAARSASRPGARPARPAARRAGRSVALVPLLAPWVSVVVVAELSQKPGSSSVSQVDAAHPLGRLPEVQVRHQQPGRAAVLGRERRRRRTRTRSRPGRRAGPPAAGWWCSRRRSGPARSRRAVSTSVEQHVQRDAPPAACRAWTTW